MSFKFRPPLTRDRIERSDAAAQSRPSQPSVVVAQAKPLAKKQADEKFEFNDLQDAFGLYDLDKSGVLTKAKLRDVFKAIGMPVSDTTLEIMISMADTDNDGNVGFDEFVTLFKNPALLLESFMSRQEPEPPVPVAEVPTQLTLDELFKQVIGKQEIRPNDIKQLYRDFDHFNSDKSGTLNLAEFHEIVGLSKPRLIVKELFRTIDSDDSGRIDFREFLVALTLISSSDPLEKLRLSFALFDDNGNGLLEPHELRSLLTASLLVNGGLESVDDRMSEILIVVRPDFVKGSQYPNLSFDEFIRLAKVRSDLLLSQKPTKSELVSSDMCIVLAMIQYILLLPICASLSVDPIDSFFDTASTAEVKRSLFLASSKAPVRTHGNSDNVKGANCPISSVAIDSCQLHAHDACYNPALSTAESLEMQAKKTSGLGQGVTLYSFQSCDDRHCQNQACSNPLEASTKSSCIACLQTCMSFCLLNTQRLCLQRVCAATVLGATEAATSQASLALQSVSPLTSSSEAVRSVARLAESSKLSLVRLAEVQKRELGDWTSNLIVKEKDGPEFCSDDAIKAADTTVIGRGGSTHTSSLLSCSKSYFTPERIGSTVRNPQGYLNDFVCSLALTCPNDQSALATSRAEKIWTRLVTLYQKRK